LRIDSDGKKLPPGEQVELVQAEGAGLVQWLQVRCPKQFLQTDELWIEIWIDGESEPAVSAPIRYFFSGAAVAGRFGNYLLTERGGPINRLAIPFGSGIQVILQNRCEQLIDDVGLTASIQRAANEQEAADFAGRLRLRGVFHSGEEVSDLTLFRQTGRGRWAGLICGASPNETTVIDMLQIDDQPAAGWQPTGLNAWLGGPENNGPFRGPLSGRQNGLAWRYLLLAPIDFEREIVATVSENTVFGGWLALFYVK
jgi:hypothetical protein